ncbi:hypothetical protein J6590_007064 [Homalodisca vitripennis]|nr:hypothetical protein J6590_007064 [Homalodisca vitripennis]
MWRPAFRISPSVAARPRILRRCHFYTFSKLISALNIRICEKADTNIRGQAKLAELTKKGCELPSGKRKYQRAGSILIQEHNSPRGGMRSIYHLTQADYIKHGSACLHGPRLEQWKPAGILGPLDHLKRRRQLIGFRSTGPIFFW